MIPSRARRKRSEHASECEARERDSERDVAAARWSTLVDRSTTGPHEVDWTDGFADRSPGGGPGATPLDAYRDLAKVRVAGSNPVVRSRSTFDLERGMWLPPEQRRFPLRHCAKKGGAPSVSKCGRPLHTVLVTVVEDEMIRQNWWSDQEHGG
jgi:hypothetical protein